MRRTQRCECALTRTRVTPAHRADCAIAPGLCTHPLDHVITVRCLVRKRIPDTTGVPASAHVVDDHGVAMCGVPPPATRVAGAVFESWRALDDGRDLPFDHLPVQRWQVHITRQFDSIA